MLKARSEKPIPTGSYHVAPFLLLFFSFGVMEYLLFGQYGLVLFGFPLFFYFSHHLHPSTRNYSRTSGKKDRKEGRDFTITIYFA